MKVQSNSSQVGISTLDNPWRGKADPYLDGHKVLDAINDSVQQSGYQWANLSKSFKTIIKPGAKVLLKPNWVLHYNQSGNGMDCMITNPTFVLQVLKMVVSANPSRIVIGDAPIQGCHWEELFTDEFNIQVKDLSSRCPIEVVDFRRTILRENLAKGVDSGRRSDEHYVLFDLGCESLLEQISVPKNCFRVTMYDPRMLAKAHRPGRHQYLLCREVFEADVILNLPKLKTHRKAGLTAGLKNLVGVNGSKDYLPHHRVGGSLLGGDCYPGVSPLKRLSEYFLDRANENIGKYPYRVWAERAGRILQIHERLYHERQLEGGWHGNDTLWRMVLDINRIAVYGRADGTLAELPQRQIFNLTDAIVCGQGNGPLAPEPLYLGIVTFSDSAVAADYVHSALLRLDPSKIPLLYEAVSDFRWPLYMGKSKDINQLAVHFKDRVHTLEGIAHRLGVNASPPTGWVGVCEWSSMRNEQ